MPAAEQRASPSLCLATTATLDVPMYFGRWQADFASGKNYLGLVAGLHDVATRWIVTHDIAQWHDEIAWMSLYFSTTVWRSLALASFGLVKHLLPHYRVRAPLARATRRPVAVRVRLRAECVERILDSVDAPLRGLSLNANMGFACVSSPR